MLSLNLECLRFKVAVQFLLGLQNGFLKLPVLTHCHPTPAPICICICPFIPSPSRHSLSEITVKNFVTPHSFLFKFSLSFGDLWGRKISSSSHPLPFASVTLFAFFLLPYCFLPPPLLHFSPPTIHSPLSLSFSSSHQHIIS